MVYDVYRTVIVANCCYFFLVYEKKTSIFENTIVEVDGNIVNEGPEKLKN